jgi:putative transposase
MLMGLQVCAPVCGEKLSPNGYRRMKCSECGLEKDRDVIAAPQIPDGCRSFRSPRRPPMKRGGKDENLF